MENSQAWVVLLLYALINHIVTKVSHQNVPHFKLTFTIALGLHVSFIYRSFPYKYSVLAPPPTKRLDNLASRSVFWIWLCLSMTPCIPPFTMQSETDYQLPISKTQKWGFLGFDKDVIHMCRFFFHVKGLRYFQVLFLLKYFQVLSMTQVPFFFNIKVLKVLSANTIMSRKKICF